MGDFPTLFPSVITLQGSSSFPFSALASPRFGLQGLASRPIPSGRSPRGSGTSLPRYSCLPLALDEKRPADQQGHWWSISTTCVDNDFLPQIILTLQNRLQAKGSIDKRPPHAASDRVKGERLHNRGIKNPLNIEGGSIHIRQSWDTGCKKREDTQALCLGLNPVYQEQIGLSSGTVEH